MRYTKFFLLAIGSLLMAFPVLGQNTSVWSAYLFDNINNELVFLSNETNPEAFSLGMPENSYIYDMSINENGSQVAFCYVQYESLESSEQSHHFVLRDIAGQNNLIETELGDIIACGVSAYQDNVIALSIVHYNPHFQEAVGDGLVWELRLIDATTGEELHNLNNETEAMPPVSMYGQENLPVMARIIEMSSDSVKFIAIPYAGTEGPPELPAFEWIFADDSITELPAGFGRWNADYLPETGELVFPALNETIPATMPFGPMPQSNVVSIMDENGNRDIYSNPDWVISSTTFINNGQSVIVSLWEGFTDNTPPDEDFMQRFALINRDGTVREFEAEFRGAAFVGAIPDGAIFIYTPNPTQESPEWKATEIHILTSEGVLAFDSAYMPNYERGYSPPQLVWTSPSVLADELAPFPAQ